MIYAYRNAGKLDEGIRKKIIEIVDKCEICKKYILWMVCACTRFIQGKVLNDRKPETIVKALHRGWCLPYGYTTIGFWSDNGGEFGNSKMKEFVSKLGLKIKFTPAYSSWSNGMLSQ